MSDDAVMQLYDLAIGTSHEDQRRMERLGAKLVELDDARRTARGAGNRRDADLLGHRIVKLRTKITNILWNPS